MKNTTSKIQSLLAKLLILATPLLFTFCGDDDGGAAKLSYSIDGQSQKVQTVTGVLASEIQYDHEGRSLNITAAAGTSKILSIAVSNWDFQNPPDNGVLTGDYDATFDFGESGENPAANCLELTGDNEGVSLCDGGLVSLITGTDFYTSVFDGDTEASITITKCNGSKRTVSGTFTAKVAGFDGLNPFTITGSFTDVKYRVQ